MDFIPEIDIKLEFRQAISPSPERDPKWYVVRFHHPGLKLIERLMGIVGIEYYYLTYEHKVKRGKPVEKVWLPGYFFARFDARLDYWQQMLNMPHVLNVLGNGPVPVALPEEGKGSVADLLTRCPRKLPPNDRFTSIPAGTTVKLKDEVFSSLPPVVVTRSDNRDAWVIAMLFDRPIELRVAIRNVEIVEKI